VSNIQLYIVEMFYAIEVKDYTTHKP